MFTTYARPQPVYIPEMAPKQEPSPVQPAICPCCKQTVPPAPSNREWTVEEILAREG